MKSTKRILALLLALAMIVAVFAACGKKETGTSTPATSTSTEENKTSTAEPEKTETSEPAPAADGPVHPCRIVQPGNLPEEYEQGIAAVNEKLKADGVDIEVSVQRIPWDSYAEKLNLMLTTGEPFELLHVMQDVKNLSAIAGMDAVLPLDDLLKGYPELVGKFTDTEWKGAVYAGDHYAVPCSWRSFANTMSYIDARTDVMTKLGYDSFPNEPDDVIELMVKMQEYILDETGIKAYNWFHQNQDTAHWLHRSYDTYPFYVENSLGLVLSRQDGTIDSFYESEEFKKDCETYYKMYQKGLVNPDVLNIDHSSMYDDANMGAFLPSQTFDPSIAVTIMKNTDLKDVEVNWYELHPEKPEMIYTFVQNLNAISSTSEDPESGLKFLNWLYASMDNHDLFHYGTEGVYFKAVGTNQIDYTDDMKTESGGAKYSLDTWMTGYMPLMRWNVDYPESEIEYMTYQPDNYVVSTIAGFIFDSSNVTTELTNLQTEIIASIYPIKIGMISYEDNIDAAIAKLKAAGLDTYMEEYRKQFAEFLEANPWALEG